MDIKTAYVNAPTDCKNLKQPGYEIYEENGEPFYKLKKLLYGLKQSRRNWNGMIHKHLVDKHFNHWLRT